MKSTNFIFLVVILVLIACEKPKERANNYDSNKEQPFESKYTLQFKDSVIIPVNNETNVASYVQLVKDQGREFLVSYQLTPEQNNFYLYDLDSAKFSRVISFNREGEHGVGKLSLFANFQDMSEIILFEQGANRFYLASSDGNILSKVDLNNKIEGWAYPQPSYPPVKADNKLHFFLMNTYNSNSKEYTEKSKAEGIYDLNEELFVNDFPNYPNYPNGIENSMDGWKASRCIGPNNEFVYSFPFDNKIVVREKDKSKVYDIPNPDFNLVDAGGLDSRDFQAQMEFISETGEYTYLFFDPYRELYYRIFLMPGEARDLDNKLIMNGEKGFRIEIINTDFKLVGRHDFEPKEFNSYCLLISESGILLSRINPHAPQVEDRFIFERFKVVESL